MLVMPTMEAMRLAATRVNETFRVRRQRSSANATGYPRPKCRYAEQTDRPSPPLLLKKVVVTATSAGRHGAHVVGHGRKDVELGLQILAQLHDGGDIAAAVAVVGGAPHGGHGLVLEMPLVALVDELVCARNQLQAIDVVELRGHFVAKQPACAAGADSPGFHFLRVAPYQVAEGAFVRDLLGARDHANLVKSADFGGQTTMYTEDFAVDESGEGEEVEDLSGGFPDGGVAVLLVALFIKAVDLGDLAGFVVAADEGDTIGVAEERSVS